MLDKLERKFGRFAIPHLMNYLIAGYAIGYLLYFGTSFTNYNFISYMTLEPFFILHQYQFWRIITWVMIPPQQNLFFAVIMMFFYWQLGNVLEQTWGTFKFNLYIWGGIIFTLIGAFILYAFVGPLYSIGSMFSTYYINMGIFLAFALCYPDMQVMLYFIIPIRMKWLALLYAFFIIFDFISMPIGGKVAIVASLLNFLVFFFATRSYRNLNPKEWKRKADFRNATKGFQGYQGYQSTANQKQAGAGFSDKSYRHKCSICGRTDRSHPELEFRYCSKCNGNYEYCQDHLFTHTHVQ